MSYVVAVIDECTLKVYAKASEAPLGSTTIGSPEELGLALPLRTIDLVREKILGIVGDPSRTAQEAALKLWYIFGIGVGLQPHMVHFSRNGPCMRDSFGNARINFSRVELIKFIWVPGKDAMADFFYKKKLRDQGKVVVAILMDDGRRIWTREQFYGVVEARGDELKSSRTAAETLRWYVSRLCNAKLIKKLTYLEFLSSPEFAVNIPKDISAEVTLGT